MSQNGKKQAEQLAEKIQQIGPVNLVAIDEFDEQSKRKEYLDGQHDDLNRGLRDMLEGVIKKIDRETRERFKVTFDLLNRGFGEFFPQLFGGGSAVLELTEDDLLENRSHRDGPASWKEKQHYPSFIRW